MYVGTQGGLCASRADGRERRSDQGEAGWGLACMSGRNVRLGLLDVHAWLTRGEAGWGACVYVET